MADNLKKLAGSQIIQKGQSTLDMFLSLKQGKRMQRLGRDVFILIGGRQRQMKGYPPYTQTESKGTHVSKGWSPRQKKLLGKTGGV
jgi:hypothetical protein